MIVRVQVHPGNDKPSYIRRVDMRPQIDCFKKCSYNSIVFCYFRIISGFSKFRNEFSELGKVNDNLPGSHCTEIGVTNHHLPVPRL